MTINGWIQIALYCVIVTLLVKPFGGYMTRVFNGERTLLSPVLRPVERGFYAVSGVAEQEEQHWVAYGIAMLVFTLAGFVSLYALQRFQAVLPFNPQGQAAVSPDLAFNTSVSFITNTNWQSYTPESTMSYLTQMAGLTVHNFVSAATGIALAHRADPRLRPALGQDRRQFLGRYDPLRALHPAAGRDRGGPVLRLAGHAAEPGRLHRGDDAGGRQAGDRAGAGRLAGSHQDLRHERRRLLQRQLRPSLREPERAHQLHPSPADLLDRRRAHQRVRPDGRQPTPWLGDLRGHGATVPRWRMHRLLGRERRQPGVRGTAREQRPECAAGRRQHGRQGGAVRHRRLGAVRDRDHRHLLRCRQHHARQLAAARGHGAAGQHHAGRDHLRRRRLRPLRDAALRHRRGLHRGPDGRAHAGIPGQEDRSPRRSRWPSWLS